MTLKINGATGGSVSIDAPDNTSPAGTDVTLTLPVNDGDAGQYLQTDGTGALSWQTVSVTPDAITEGNTSVECVDTGSNGHITFDTEGTEVARINSSSHILVGTTSARTVGWWDTLFNQIEGPGYQQAGLLIYQHANDIYPAVLGLGKTRGTTAGSNTIVQDGDQLGAIAFYGSDGSQEQRAAEIGAFVDGTPGSNDMPTRLAFSTTPDGANNPTERLRIQPDGILVKYGDSNSARILPQSDNAGYIGEASHRWQAIYATNGTIQTSDEREKTEIVDSPLGTDFIKSLRPVAYKWKVGGYEHSVDEEGEDVFTPVAGQRTHYGFIAQEVRQAVGDADFGGWLLEDLSDPDSKQSLRLHEFISPMVKALQESIAKIETLETANASQAATIAAFEARLTALEGGAA